MTEEAALKEGASKKWIWGWRVRGRLWERRATGERRWEWVQSFAKQVQEAESPGGWELGERRPRGALR